MTRGRRIVLIVIIAILIVAGITAFVGYKALGIESFFMSVGVVPNTTQAQ